MKLKTKFQDEDFKLGEVVDASIMYGYADKIEVSCTGKMKHRKYNSIKDFTDHWEDAPEEPKEDGLDNIIALVEAYSSNDSERYPKEIVKKLKAWKRLEVHNLRVERGQRIFINADNKLTSQKPLFVVDTYEEVEDDLDILFGGEE